MCVEVYGCVSEEMRGGERIAQRGRKMVKKDRCGGTGW